MSSFPRPFISLLFLFQKGDTIQKFPFFPFFPHELTRNTMVCFFITLGDLPHLNREPAGADIFLDGALRLAGFHKPLFIDYSPAHTGPPFLRLPAFKYLPCPVRRGIVYWKNRFGVPVIRVFKFSFYSFGRDRVAVATEPPQQFFPRTRPVDSLSFSSHGDSPPMEKFFH